MESNHHLNIKVLHIINGEHYSGGERVQDILGLTLPDYGYDVGFICLKPDLFPQVYRSKTSPIYELPMKHRADIGGPLKALRNIIRSENYKLLHSHMPRTAPVARLASILENVPLVHHIHCPTLFDSPNLVKNIASATLERISLIGASMIIPCSEGMKSYARSVRISEKKLCVVLNGIPQLGPLINRSHSGELWTFGMVALYRPRKGLEYLLSALKTLKEKNFRFKFKAIGDFMSEDYRTEILDLVRQLKIEDLIDWVGFKKDIPQELMKLDFFVLPSIGGEGLPIAILEAMAAGMPIITTSIPGNREVIRHGIDGYLCAPKNADSLAENMAKIMGDVDNWKIMRSNAYHRQKEHFSDQSMASGIANIYSNILNA